MRGLVPRIHDVPCAKTWMPAFAGMTACYMIASSVFLRSVTSMQPG
jgi:hypothetical protein